MLKWERGRISCTSLDFYVSQKFLIGNLPQTGTAGPTRSPFSDLVELKKMQQLHSGVRTRVRREVVEDGAVCSEPQVRSMDCHGNSSVGVNEKQRSDPATLTSVNKFLFLCPLIVQALILESCSFNVDSLLFLSFLSLHFSPPHPPHPGFHIPDPKLALLASRGLQQASSADYEHGGYRPSHEVTGLGGMLHVREEGRGSRGRPNPLIWNTTSP